MAGEWRKNIELGCVQKCKLHASDLHWTHANVGARIGIQVKPLAITSSY